MKINFNALFAPQFATLTTQDKVILDLSNNKFSSQQAIWINCLMSEVPKECTMLNLNSNDLGAFTTQELGLMIGSLCTRNLKLLSLGFNNLGRHTGDSLSVFFKEIQDIESLDLSYNNLGAHKGLDLDKAFKVIPAPIKNIDLSSNNLGNCSVAALVQLMAALPKTVTMLNICNNNLGIFSNTDLEQIFAATPKKIQIIKIEGNNLTNRTNEEWINILSKLPSSVDKVLVDDEETQKQINMILQARRAQPTIDKDWVALLNTLSPTLQGKTLKELMDDDKTTRKIIGMIRRDKLLSGSGKNSDLSESVTYETPGSPAPETSKTPVSDNNLNDAASESSNASDSDDNLSDTVSENSDTSDSNDTLTDIPSNTSSSETSPDIKMYRISMVTGQSEKTFSPNKLIDIRFEFSRYKLFSKSIKEEGQDNSPVKGPDL